MPIDVIMIGAATFGLSSAWLFSPGPAAFRSWWIAKTGPLAALGYCQLCSAFWIGLGLHLFFAGPSPAIAWALGYAGASWMLGALTNFCLWSVVKAKKDYEDSVINK